MNLERGVFKAWSLSEPEVKNISVVHLLKYWCNYWLVCAWSSQVRYPPWVLHNEAVHTCKFACVDLGLGMGIYIALRTLILSVVGGAPAVVHVHHHHVLWV